MDWITGIQNAIDYMEEHLTEELDFDEIARQSFSSSYHFQRTFHILCGYTLGEYIRNRRLSLAAAELLSTDLKVIDIALKYGYDSPDSFTRAFQKFHGITPSQVRSRNASLKSFSRLHIKLSLEGGFQMDYKIKEIDSLQLIGYKKRFQGTPPQKAEQEKQFFLTTRRNQHALQEMADDSETIYCVMQHFEENSYDFYIAAKTAAAGCPQPEPHLGEDMSPFEKIPIPSGKYIICETKPSPYPTLDCEAVRKQLVEGWLPSSGYELDNRPELAIYHWYDTPHRRQSRYAELWIPICKA